ncbi:mannosyltransferase [Mycobacterium sp.]|uniref:mannosyltransferase n=1 Tax=Mycobacterium sp. TaxID=1785 RepID=UPI002D3791CF|nr:mannosyltransferase [Mycobacterium sp.]HZA12308.1 mannosyltransferase [Mycobacterium sp.]
MAAIVGEFALASRSAHAARVGPVNVTPAVTSTATPPRSPGRLTAVAPLLLAVSVAARFAWTFVVRNGANFVDLHVYVGGAATIGTPNRLYDYVYSAQTPDFPLPFTYPPFAAVIFYPLHLLPFGLLAFCWQLGTIAALYGVVRLSQRLLGRGDHRQAMLWTAVGIWIEPLRSTLDYGQINVLLVLAVLYAVYSTRWWLSGLLVGLAAGVKLTPAISGLYFLGVRRWGTAIFAAAVFFATVGVSLLVLGDQSRFYFTDLLGDANRVGPIGTSFNQSWRGGISRILGHDAGYGPLVLAAIAVTAVLALAAWRAVGADDRLGEIVVVQLFGLLLSPISWTHHWVWLLPTMIWLLVGPLRDRTGARILGWGWLALTLVGPPWLLSYAQPTIWQISRSWYLAWAGLVYIVATLITLGWIAATGRRSRLSPEPSQDRSR